MSRQETNLVLAFVKIPIGDTIKWIGHSIYHGSFEQEATCLGNMYPCISKPAKTPEIEHISYTVYYRKENREFKFVLGEFNSKQLSKLKGFNIKKPTIIITHGWLGRCDKPTALDLVKGKYKVIHVVKETELVYVFRYFWNESKQKNVKNDRDSLYGVHK